MTEELIQLIFNHSCYCRRPLIVMRPHTDHKTNKKNSLTLLDWIITSKEDFKRAVASFLF